MDLIGLEIRILAKVYYLYVPLLLRQWLLNDTHTGSVVQSFMCLLPVVFKEFNLTQKYCALQVELITASCRVIT